jgi:hypothetical protein
MKNHINVYWGIEERFQPGLPLLANPIEAVIPNYIKNNKSHDYIKCPAFSREFQNTFIYKSLYDFTIDLDPTTLEPKPTTTLPLILKDPQTKNFSIRSNITFFSDEPLEMSQIPSSLHINNFTNSTNVFSGKYNIGKWFRPLGIDFILKTPFVKVKRDDPLFYLKFHTDKKLKFINFRYNEEISKIENACLNLKQIQSNFRFKDVYSFFLRIGYHKKLLREIKKNTTDLK